MRLQGREAITDADAIAHHLAGDGGCDIGQGVADAEVERVEPQLLRQHVQQLFLRHHRLRHAEAAEGPGGHAVGEHGARGGAVVRHHVRPRGMHRHAVGHRRPP